MNALILGVGSAALGMIVHTALLRMLPRRLRLALLPVFLLIALVFLGLAIPLPGSSIGVEGWAVGLVLSLSLGLAYALLLNGVLYDSPTLALVNEIEAHGPDGMPLAAFESFVARHPFVRSRLQALVAARELSLKDGQLEFAGNAVHLLRLGDAYRKLRGDAEAGAG
jgi:hypothetical protein